MAGYRALAAAGLSIVALLERRFAEQPGAGTLSAFLASNKELKTMKDDVSPLVQKPAVSLFCYRVSVDRETRPGWSGVASVDGVPRLPLRMHFLLAAWANNIEDELRFLGLAAQVLESEPLLAGPLLHPDGEWEPGDAVQVLTDDLALDSMSEAFQALSTDYQLSLPYLARVIRIDGRRGVVSEPVATVADRVQGAGR
jgi:hypothetical protein